MIPVALISGIKTWYQGEKVYHRFVLVMMLGNTPETSKYLRRRVFWVCLGGFIYLLRRCPVLRSWISIGYIPVLILIAFSECLRHWIANRFLWKFNSNGIAVGCRFTCLKHCKEHAFSTPYMFYMFVFVFSGGGFKCDGSALSVQL